MTDMCELLDSGFLDRKSVAGVDWGVGGDARHHQQQQTKCNRMGRTHRAYPPWQTGGGSRFSPEVAIDASSCHILETPVRRQRNVSWLTARRRHFMWPRSAKSGPLGWKGHDAIFIKCLLFMKTYQSQSGKQEMGGKASVFVQIKWLFRQTPWPWNDEFCACFSTRK